MLAGRAAKSAAAIMIISALSKFLGLFRESVIAAFFGAGSETDAYRVAFEVPSVLTGVIYAAIATTFIPVYSDFKNETRERRLYFVNNLFNIVTLITALIAVFGMAAAPLLVKFIAPGFEGGTHELAVKFTVLLCPSVVFLALAYLANGYLQSNRRFAITAFMGIPLNLTVIFSVILFGSAGIEALAVGSLLAMASQFLIQAPALFKEGYRFFPVFDFKEPGFRKVLILSVPVFISTAFNEASILIDKMLASGFDAGSISVLDYASKVNGIAGGIFFSSLAIVLFPELAAASEDAGKFAKAVTAGLKTVILISFPIMAVIFVQRAPIIRLLFERGAFDPVNTKTTSALLGFYSIGIIGSGVTALLNRTFYSLKDTKTPMVNGILSICVNIVLSFIFARIWGIFGLASASAFASLFCGLSLFIRIGKRISLRFGDMGKLLIKCGAAAAAAGSLMYFLSSRGVWPLHEGAASVTVFLKLAVISSAGFIAYICMLFILKTSELTHIVKPVLKKFGWPESFLKIF